MVIVDNGKQCRHCRQVTVRRLALLQLDDRATDTPDIRSRAGAGQLDNLRCHPVRGANNLSFLILASSERARGDTKVGQLDSAVLCGEDVGALDVTMDDTLVVQILEALKNLRHVDAHQVLGKLAVRLAYRVQRAVLTISGGVSFCVG